MTDQEAVHIVRGQTQMIASIEAGIKDPMTKVMTEAMERVVELAQEQLTDRAMRKMLDLAGGKNENKNNDGS